MAESRKQELIRELEQARQKITISRAGLSDDLHFGDKITGNLTRYRGAWLAGALITGLVISKIPPRTKKVKVKVPVLKSSGEKQAEKAGAAGLGLMALKFAFDVGKPFLMKYLTQRMRGRI
jgi:hypothetical protein